MENGRKTVGILAIQGDYSLHAKMLERIGAQGFERVTQVGKRFIVVFFQCTKLRFMGSLQLGVPLL